MVQVIRPAAAALAAALLLGGCGASEPVKPDRFYSLGAVPQRTAATVPAPAILLVNSLAAQGFLGGRQIVYRTRESPLVVQRYEDLLWEDPPSRAIAAALVEALRAAKVFQFVVIPADRARADFLLGGEVERFEHLPTEQPPRVSASFTLTLVRANDRGSIANRRYSGEEPVDGVSPDAMAEAFNRLTARLVAEAVRDLETLKPRLVGNSGP